MKSFHSSNLYENFRYFNLKVNYYHCYKKYNKPSKSVIFIDIEKEKEVEQNITKIIRENFSFKFIELEGEKERIGTIGLESKRIGTVAKCKVCSPTDQWLGKFSPIQKIRDGKLWLTQLLQSPIINEIDKKMISNSLK
jgi:hypothetical protein